MAAADQEKTLLELSCDVSRIISTLIPLDKHVKEMRAHEIAAVWHYIYCKACRDKGFSELLDTTMSCREAILVWAEHPRALWLKIAPDFIAMETPLENYAVEHVWGKYQWKNSMGECGFDIFTCCKEHPCTRLRHYWLGVPMSSHYNGGSGVRW